AGVGRGTADGPMSGHSCASNGEDWRRRGAGSPPSLAGEAIPAVGRGPVRLTLAPPRVTIEVRSALRPNSGPVAQLGARMNGIHEVTGSTPVWSTTQLVLA